MDVLKKQTSKVRHLFEFMAINKMKLQFQESTTIYGSQLNHIWSNNPSEQCVLGMIMTFLTNYKPIHFAFKLLDHVPQFHCPIMFIFLTYNNGQYKQLLW